MALATKLISYVEEVNSIMPGARIIKLRGYSNGNADYSKAKVPVGSWKKSPSLNDEQINSWLSKKGWIGAVIPNGLYVVDFDNEENGQLVKELLEGENVDHHAIQTPHGMQFIFKGESKQTQQQGLYSKYINRLGIAQDARTSTSNSYIVFPTENTDGRNVLTQPLDNLDELPTYLYKVWHDPNEKFNMGYPYDGSGSRNTDFYDLARRIFTCDEKLKIDDAKESLTLAYKYFVHNQDDYPLNELYASIDSAHKKVHGENDNANSAAQSDISSLPDDSGDVVLVESTGKSAIIPKPFKVSKGSLFEEKEDKNGNIQVLLVSRKTPFITKEFKNVERPQLFYEISWKDHNRSVEEVVPASTLSTRKALLELSDNGLSVNENNVKKMISFFDKFQFYNDIERYHAVDRLGSIKNGFVHPSFDDGVKILAIDEGEKQLLEGFEMSGTSETWGREVFERIKDQPKAVIMVLASFASVIIKDLHVQPFIVDLSGSTSQGKTTTLKIAGSVWGNKNLINEWNATRVSIERKASYLNSYPLLMDDTRKADDRVLKSVIYQFSGGRSKGRGSVKGSQREYTWTNIMLSTGEVSLNEYAKNQGGAAARIIPLVDEPLKKDYENITHLYEAIENNYGTIGFDFLNIWLNHKKELIPEYANFKKHYIDKSRENEVLSRLAEYYATVHFTGSILKNRLGLDVDLESISQLFDNIAHENKAIDKPMQMLEEILTDLDNKRNNIEYGTGYRPPIEVKAIYKEATHQLFLTPAYTKDFLGVEEKQIRREWLKRGITVPKYTNGEKKDYMLISQQGNKYRAIAINREIVNELGFDFTYRDTTFNNNENQYSTLGV
jgi:uncharacterized protein (DUF927 family)